MGISAVNNVNFGTKENKQDGKVKEKNRYFKFVSQNFALDSLKLSKGREVEDGKFKFATAVTGLSAIASGYFSTLSLIKLKGEYMKHFSREIGAAFFEDEKLAAKFVKNNKIAKYGLIASVALGITSLTLKCINELRAEKTANNRGFLTNQQRMKMNKADDVYKAVSQTYDNNVK